MVTKDAPGPRIDAAKSAATTLINGLPGTTPVGLLTYGTHSGSATADKSAGCKDITVLAKTAPISASKSALQSSLSSISPRGYTPIGAALDQAVKMVGTRGSVVLISDGEDTCAPPDPCKTAESLAKTHPSVTISTVGFRTDSSASKQLACIATKGNGLFVTASNTTQLTKRLAATSDVATAKSKLTSTGIGSVQLGQSYSVIASGNAGFPQWAGGHPYSGANLTGLSGASGASDSLKVIVWRDCSYVFDAHRVLVAIEPNGASTIDDIGPGSSPAQAQSVYGKARSTSKNSDGTYTVLYDADQTSASKYQVIYSGDPTAGGTVIKIVYLCTCKVPATEVTLTLNTDGSVSEGGSSMPITSFAAMRAWLTARLGSPTHEYASRHNCFGSSGYHALWFGQVDFVWTDTSLEGQTAVVAYPGPVHLDDDTYRGVSGGPRVTLPGGVGIGSTVDDLRAAGLTVGDGAQTDGTTADASVYDTAGNPTISLSLNSNSTVSRFTSAAGCTG